MFDTIHKIGEDLKGNPIEVKQETDGTYTNLYTEHNVSEAEARAWGWLDDDPPADVRDALDDLARETDGADPEGDEGEPDVSDVWMNVMQ